MLRLVSVPYHRLQGAQTKYFEPPAKIYKITIMMFVHTVCVS